MNGANAILERAKCDGLPSSYGCPECGGPMLEVERTREKRLLFILHRCVEAECGGRWLEKAVAAIKDY
jgi:hypothetical protein